MKLSEILTESRTGAFIGTVKVEDSKAYKKRYPNAKGGTTYASTLFQKKYVNREKGDEIVPAMGGVKETNISALERALRYEENQTMHIMIGNKSFHGVIEFDI